MNRAKGITKSVAEPSPLYRPIMQKAYACTGLPRPVRIKGRLAWKVSDRQALLSGGAK